jgi:hypothetical protein
MKHRGTGGQGDRGTGLSLPVFFPFTNTSVCRQLIVAVLLHLYYEHEVEVVCVIMGMTSDVAENVPRTIDV